MQFSFANVQAAEEGRPMTSPGTIAAFKIEEVEYLNNNGKESFKVTFGRKEDSFNEYYHLTPKAAERFVYLYSKVVGTETLPDNEQGIIAALKDKTIALKVIGSINNQNGKGYPALPYSGYARPVANIDELKFSASEQGKIDATLQAQRQSMAAQNQGGGDPAEAAEANRVLGGDDDF